MNLDPNEFLSQSQSTGKLSTVYPKVDPGEYAAIVDGLKLREYPKKDDASQTVTVVDVVFFVDDARAKEVTGLDKPTVRQSIFLDLANGKLDSSKGKNVGLGKLCEALGVNTEKDWSFNDLIGRACIVKVEHSENPKDAENPFTNVTKVGKIGG